MTTATPAPFLTVIVRDLADYIPVEALCAGFETGKWRDQQFAEHLLEWLPEFALDATDLAALGPGNAVRLIRKAAKLVYQTEKYGKRGEFGELLLHVILRQLYQTVPAIAKIYWKDSVNSTVKGFDAVHVVSNDSNLELWLGEVKFYEDGKGAIDSVIPEIVVHTQTDYLRNEFMLISNKLNRDWPYFEKLSKLLDPNTSLDDVFDVVCIPILITYDSEAISKHQKNTKEYLADVSAEVTELTRYFMNKLSRNKFPVRLHFFAVPLSTKSTFVSILDAELKRLQ